METSLSAGVFEQGTSIESMIAETVSAGFEAIELPISEDGVLSFESSEQECLEIGKMVMAAGLRVSALALDCTAEANLASRDLAGRRRAHDQAGATLDRAAWLGTDAVVMAPGVVEEVGASRPITGYEEAYLPALTSLLALRFEAERRAVCIACECCRHLFLVSPLEMRDFIDRVNSPWVRASLDPVVLARHGDAQDWIRTLGHRLARVYFRDFVLDTTGRDERDGRDEGTINWPGIVAALRQIRYEGPVTYRGIGEPADVSPHLARILESR